MSDEINSAAEPTDVSPEIESHQSSGLDLARSLLAAAKAKQNSAPLQKSGLRKQLRKRVHRGGDPTSLGEVIAALAAERGWEADISSSTLLAQWSEIAGPDLAAHVQAESLRDGILTLRAETTAWATQTRLLATELLGKVQSHPEGKSVTTIKVLAPTPPSWRKGERHVKGRGPRDTYG